MTFTWELVPLLVDTALFVLIWCVQLVVYPAFGYMSLESLDRWHRLYTPRIAILTAPLMSIQLLWYLIMTFRAFSPVVAINCMLASLLWGLTFWYFVPLHRRIHEGNYTDLHLHKLRDGNWWRTVGWTIIWGLHWI